MKFRLLCTLQFHIAFDFSEEFQVREQFALRSVLKELTRISLVTTFLIDFGSERSG